MDVMVSKCWNLCKRVSYNNESESTFGDPNKGDFGLVDIDDKNKTAWIVFRGSDDLHDWLSNFLQQRINSKGHNSGFEKSARKFRDRYLAIPDGYTVNISGFSRGGGLGLMAAVDILHEKPGTANKINVVTFGSPRACIKDSLLYKAIKDRQITHNAVTSGMDLVPLLPSRLTMMLGFRFNPRAKYVNVATVNTNIGARLKWWRIPLLALRLIKHMKAKGKNGSNVKYSPEHSMVRYHMNMVRLGLI